VRVLIVMPEQSRATKISHFLSTKGVTSELADGGFYALTMLERIKPDAIIVAQDVDDMSGFDVYDIVRSDEDLDSVRFILLDEAAQISGEIDTALTANAPPADILAALERPAPSKPDRFHNRVHSASSSSKVNGTLEVLTLFDLVMSLSQNGRSGRLYLYIGEDEAQVILQAGQVIHASFQGDLGEEAFKHIFFHSENTDDTEFLFEGSTEIARATEPFVSITTPIQELLFKVAVELDHLRADSKDAKPQDRKQVRHA